MEHCITIPERITIKTGCGGLRFFELRCNGAEAHVYLHGAHVLHYQPANHVPVLWHSQKSYFEAGKPIRGGIPVCWPWFGAHPTDTSRPAHGVARLAEWEPVASAASTETTALTLRLPAEQDIHAIAELTVTLGKNLKITLTTINTGDAVLPLSDALHSYFAVHDVRNISVSGLERQPYIDMVSVNHFILTQAGAVTFTAETDRIYPNSTSTCVIHDPGMNRRIFVEKEGSQSTVVWNPWIEKSLRMIDYGNEEYPQMVCVETANCGPNRIQLASGRTHSMTTRIYAEGA